VSWGIKEDNESSGMDTSKFLNVSGIVFMITRVIIVYLNTSISSTPQI
jgi:hypothetical protein